MLRSAVVFLVIALIAGVFGYGGFASDIEEIARSVFVPFAVLGAVGLLVGYAVERSPD